MKKCKSGSPSSKTASFRIFSWNAPTATGWSVPFSRERSRTWNPRYRRRSLTSAVAETPSCTIGTCFPQHRTCSKTGRKTNPIPNSPPRRNPNKSNSRSSRSRKRLNRNRLCSNLFLHLLLICPHQKRAFSHACLISFTAAAM